jgi:isoleucyl-tRNA synthetase
LVKDIAEVKRKVIATFWNSYSFFVTYANVDHYEPKELPIGVGLQNILDRWVLAELHLFIKNFEEKMEDYRLTRASRLIGDFLDKLSNWYIRRSRRRFWKSENDTDKDQAYATLYDVLVKLSQVMAPLMPFVAETVYKNLTQKESVHLTDFPKWEKSLIDESLLEKMALARRSVTLALAIRAKEKIKARKPLLRMFVSIKALAEDKEIAKIIAEEVNVKEVFFREKESLKPEKEIKTAKEEDLAVGLDTEITPELKLEGEAREIIRLIQEMRRQAGYEVDNHIVIGYGGGDAVFNSFGYLIVKETLADELKAKKLENPDQEKKLSTDSGDITLTIKKA